MNAGYYSQGGGADVFINGFYFDRTNKYIYFQSYVEISAYNVPLQDHPNYSAIIVGSLIS